MTRSFRAAAALPLLLVTTSPVAAQTCLIPTDLIVSGGVGRDGIPALTEPASVTAAEGDAFLAPDDLVLGVEIAGEARAYPHNVLWWHEVVNDVVGGTPIVVSYCPLTGSGIVADPVIDGEIHNFGVSGLLFDNNLILFDRTTESLWSQMRNESICGTFSGRVPVLKPVVQSTWAAWKALHPETRVVSFDTGFRRGYQTYPYGTYDQLFDGGLLFPHSFIDGRRPLKELVLGIAEGEVARAYPYEGLGDRAVINDVVGERAVAVVYDDAARMAIAFDRALGGQTLNLELVVGESEGFPFHLRDTVTGTVFDLRGLAVEGALAGERLPQVATFSAMWFAWASFHRDTGLFLP